MSTLQSLTQHKNEIKKRILNRNLENEVRESEIKNEMKSKIEYWHECRHCSGQNKFKKIKLLNREIKIEI